MIENFIREILHIETFIIVEHKVWKDNRTYEVIQDSWESIIVQELSTPKNTQNKDFMEKVIHYYNSHNNTLLFAKNHNEKRFYDYEWAQFQVMERLSWNSIDIWDISDTLIQETAEKLAHFHNCIVNFSTDEFQTIKGFKKLSEYKEIARNYIQDCGDDEIKKVFYKLEKASYDLEEKQELPISVIHGDPSFKNFLIDSQSEIIWLIDYDMMAVNTTIWDLADLIRSYLKLEFFSKKSFQSLVNSYNEIRLLTLWEKKSLIDYCKMSVLDTGFRYIISYFDNSNLQWGKEDSLKKAQRCYSEIGKLSHFSL